MSVTVMTMRQAIVGGLLAGAALLGDAPAALAKDAPAPGAVLRIPHERYVLPNGLEVILAQNSRLPRVTVNLRYKVGSWSDAPGRAGAAHVYEHLYAFSRIAVAKVRLEEVGATQVGATTEFDRTVYYTTVPAAQLEAVLAIESERMGTIGRLIDQKLLTREGKAVRNERRLVVENRPYSLVDEAIFRNVFPKGHPYDHLYIGLHRDVQAITLDEARGFFAKYYTPNNAILTIAGDFRTPEAKRLVAEYFGGLARGETIVPPGGAMPAVVAARETVRDRIDRTRVSLAWRSPANYAPGSAEADLLSVVLGHGISSRLHRRLVIEDKLAQSVSAYAYPFRLGSAFVLNAIAVPGVDPAKVEQAMGDEIARLVRDGPTAEELVRARNTLEMRMIRGLEKNGDIIDRSGLTLDPPYGGTSEQLSECSHLTGNPDCVPARIAAYRGVTAASLRQAAAALFASPRIVVTAVPGERVIDDPAVPASADTDEEEAPATKPAAAHDTSPAADDRPVSAALPAPRVIKLANGLTVYHVQEANAPAATVLLAVKGGTSASPRPGLSAFVMDMLAQGTQRRSAAQVAQDAAQLGSVLETDLDRDAMALRISVQPTNVAAALDLLADVARHPAFAPDAIDKVRAARRDRIAQTEDAVDPAASLALTRALYGAQHPLGSGGLFNDVLFARQHPYGYEDVGTVESLQTLDRADLTAQHQAAFRPENAALIVSGDFPEAEIRKLATRYFGDWRGGPGARQAIAAPEPVREHLILKPTGPSSQSIIRIGASATQRNAADALALRLTNIVFGEVYASRITANLREKNGFTYMARSRAAFGSDGGVFALGSSVKAEASAAAVGEVFNEMTRIGRDLVDPKELQFARSYYENALLDQFETSTAAVTSLSDLFVYDLPVGYFSGLSGQAAQVTREAVRDSARRYLVPSRMVVVAVGPAEAIKAIKLPAP